MPADFRDFHVMFYAVTLSLRFVASLAILWFLTVYTYLLIIALVNYDYVSFPLLGPLFLSSVRVGIVSRIVEESSPGIVNVMVYCAQGLSALIYPLGLYSSIFI